MAVVHNTTFVTRQITPPQTKSSRLSTVVTFTSNSVKTNGRRTSLTVTAALDGGSNKNNSKGVSVPNSNYMVPLDLSSSSITRPLVEILRDLNKRIPDNIIVNTNNSAFIPWYHANRMLSFYAPGWCGEIRDVIFSDTGSVTVVYRVTVRGSDGEAHRESTGTVFSSTIGENVDPVAAAEEIAFGKACARFGLGLYLFHEE
ncbi:DNA repair RAD52-like protein 2, chloroplastic [Rutidosis leptorrhynchoides]|uniref:DNA repair RAD52-like protein 2, chloroplastic n=1 Tax=Rutidosis leptorrhynchoides TaxID=125765 RepID=UPI003A9A59D4